MMVRSHHTVIGTSTVFQAAVFLALATSISTAEATSSSDQTAIKTHSQPSREVLITLPDQKRPIPEPAPAGRQTTGFKIRGTKGWAWTPEQYLAEIPVLARYKMNFLMNCYLSLFDMKAKAGHQNRWWEPFSPALKNDYERVVRQCQKHNIEFCFAMHPNLGSSRMIDYDSDTDLDSLWQHYAWMAGLGVNWFSICLDDIHGGIDPAGQAKLVNRMFERLRVKNPQAKMVFCPTVYMGTGVDQPNARAYLPVLAEHLHPDVYCFWTGPRVVSLTITRADAESYKSQIKHRLIIWDNYPVNDANPTLHLGPIIARDADLCEVADGYMANPLSPQNQINRLPLLTQADYAYNPAGYDPARSIGQAIFHLADTTPQRRVLRDLVELFPGNLTDSTKNTDYNPVLERFEEVMGQPNSRYLADLMIQHVQDVSIRFKKTFPDRFDAARNTLAGTLKRMQEAYAKRYGRPD